MVIFAEFFPQTVINGYCIVRAGFCLTVQTTVLSDLVGVEHVARAQAFTLFVSGLGALVAVPLAGQSGIGQNLGRVRIWVRLKIVVQGTPQSVYLRLKFIG